MQQASAVDKDVYFGELLDQEKGLNAANYAARRSAVEAGKQPHAVPRGRAVSQERSVRF